MTNKIHDLLNNSIVVSLFVLAVVALPSTGIAQTADDTGVSAEAEASAEAEIGTSGEEAIETIEIVVGVSESFALEGSGSQDDAEVRSYTWAQVGGPFKFDMSTEDINSLTPPEPGTYSFELVVQEGDREYVEKRVNVSVNSSDENADALDPDDDGDGIPLDTNSETEETEDESEDNRNTPGARLVPSQPRVIIYPSAGSNDGTEPFSVRLHGVDVDFLDTDSDDDGLDDGTGSMVSGENWESLVVDGATVRGWDQKTKDAVRARLAEVSDKNNVNDFGMEVAAAALDNGNISEISSNDERTEIHYDTTIKLFGFIPINSKAVARAEAGGETSVEYPWYAFLATKPDHSAMVSLVTDIRTSHDVMISVEEEGAPVNYREEEEDSSQ